MPVDRSQLNAVGDIIVTETQAFRALADPLSLRLFDLLRRLGPVGIPALAAELDADEEHIRIRLAAMEAANLVDAEKGDRGRWSTPATGIYFEIPHDRGDAEEAARALSNVMLGEAAELPRRWVDEAEPGLSLDWARSAGLLNARVELTSEELRDLQVSLELLLEPFTNREDNDRPPGTATVRILTFFMPEPT